jgi:TrwC relaxase
MSARSGYDLAYVWKGLQGQGERTAGGYYINAAQSGEPPGRWFGRGAESLGFTTGQMVDRQPYEAVYQQVDPRDGSKLGRSPGGYAKFAENLAGLQAAEPHATAERLQAVVLRMTGQLAGLAERAAREARRMLANGRQALRRRCSGATLPVRFVNRQGGSARTVLKLVPLPIGERDDIRRLEKIAAETAEWKKKARPLAGSTFRTVLLQPVRDSRCCGARRGPHGWWHGPGGAAGPSPLL